MRRVVLSILAGVLLATSASCYGPFRLTKKIHAWNGTLGNDIVEEIVFLAFVIIPVYGVCGFLDGVVLNTIEYWTGNVLIGAADAPVPGEERRFAGADGSESVVTYLGEGRVRLEERGVVRVMRVATPPRRGNCAVAALERAVPLSSAWRGAARRSALRAAA